MSQSSALEDVCRSSSLFDLYRDGLRRSLLPYLAASMRDDERGRTEAESLLSLLTRSFPERPFATWAVESTLRFNRMILEEERYFKNNGSYRRQPEDADQVNADVYQSAAVMNGYYLPGLFLSYITWPHHQSLLDFYKSRFLDRSNPSAVMEWGVGHGLLTVLAARAWPHASLFAFDISPYSLSFTKALMDAEGQAFRCRFCLGDVLDCELPEMKADRIICAELLEHVAQPAVLLSKIATALTDDGKAFLTAAINAPQSDHIAYFASAAEVTDLVEAAGLRVMESRVLVHPHRAGDATAPTVLAMIACKREFS